MQLNQLKDNYTESLEKIMEVNPNISINSVAGLILTFAKAIKENIENSEEKDITWDHPFIRLEYPLATGETGNEFIFLKKHNKNTFIDNAVEKNFIDVFKSITKGISITKEKDTTTRNVPEEIQEKFKKLPHDKQYSAIENYLSIEPIIIKPLADKPTLVINLYPLFVDQDNNRKYFSVQVNFDCASFKPNKWSEKTNNDFWNCLFDYILKTPDEKRAGNNFDSSIIPLPAPTVKTVETKNKLIKTSLHTELQKFGKKPKHTQGSIFDLLDPIDEDTKKDIVSYQINVVGIENTQAQNQSLFAIQKLLHETGYKGNIKGKKLSAEDNSFKFTGNLPYLKFTYSDYLEAYGVSKRQTSRGKSEYNANERAEALKAMIELSEKKYIFYYARKYWMDGKELFDVIKTVRPIFNIIEGYEALDNSEMNIMQTGETAESLNEKLKVIAIEPCPILVDQIDSYFVLKPANCYEEIKLLVGKTSKHVPLFIDFLRAEVAKREINARGNEIDWTLEMNYETLAHKLRMDGFIKAKQTKRIKDTLQKCYSVARDLGYLLSQKTVKSTNVEVEQLILNPDKFRRVKEIDEERKKLN